METEVEIRPDFTLPVNEKQKQEAEELGLTLLSRTNKSNYNYYQFNCCRDFAFLQPTHVRKGHLLCKGCTFSFMSFLGEDIGYSVVEVNKGISARYIKPCGHVANLGIDAILKSTGEKCETCFDIRLRKTAESNGYKLLSRKNKTQWYIEFKACGHSKITVTSQILKGNVECKICVELGHIKVAQDNGLIYNGAPSIIGKGYRNYIMPCGHSKDLRIAHVFNRNWQCDICNYTHKLRPSLVYLIAIKSKDFVCLKLGYAEKIEDRIYSFRLKDTVVDVIKTKQFETGLLAAQYERALHHKYNSFRLDKKLMKQYMENGTTECYPLSMLDTLLKELDFES